MEEKKLSWIEKMDAFHDAGLKLLDSGIEFFARPKCLFAMVVVIALIIIISFSFAGIGMERIVLWLKYYPPLHWSKYNP